MLFNQLGELARLFFKLGAIAFGGPAVHIAMMEDEVVQRRGWLTREDFLDLVGATNLIPGPNSTEMAMHLGYIRAGWLGLIVAGASFILPAVTITGALAWLYVQVGTLPQVAPLLYGIKPAVLGVIVAAVWRLLKAATKSRDLLLVGMAVTVAVLLGVNEVVALLLGGLLGMLVLKAMQAQWLGVMVLPGLVNYSSVAVASPPMNGNVPLWQLGLFFLKVGCVLYGSGYVLVAFLQGGLVDNLGWLTQQELLDAVAIGQFTPGPVLSTATFIGYLIAGVPGAIVSTVGIFLPSFFFVAALNPLIPKLRASQWTAAFLDAVNVSAVALMLVVTLELAFAICLPSGGGFDWVAALIAVGATVLAIRRVNAAWLVIGGAVIGWVVKL